jgi:hypothetical protein
MTHQQFTIPQQFLIGDIKINTQAQLRREYTRQLIDAFVPHRDAMLSYLDELCAKYDPQLVESQLAEARKQSKKNFDKLDHLSSRLTQTEESEQKSIILRSLDIHEEENALRQTEGELRKKLGSATRSRKALEDKKEDILQLLTTRQEMREEGTWEQIGEKEKYASVFSLLGDDSLHFEFSKKELRARAINDIYDWMIHYHPESLPPGEPFPASLAPKNAPVPKKKEAPPQPQTEFSGIPDVVTANLRMFLTIRRPGYVLLSLVDRSDAEKRAWVALLTRKRHDDTVERVSDVIIELEPQKYMTIQNVQDPPAIQHSPDAQTPS